jgi:hypothetical protein
MVAIDLLQRARAQLEESTLFQGKGDFEARWQPVFAGLAVLNAVEGPSGSDQPTRKYDAEVWSELKVIGERIMGAEKFELAEPQQLWEGVA